jgi:hypothetical protein
LNQRIHEFALVLLGALLGERFARDDSVRKKLTHVRPNFVVCAFRMGLGNVASDMNSWQMWARGEEPTNGAKETEHFASDGIWTKANGAMQRMPAYTAHEFASLPAHALTHPEDHEQIRSQLKKLRSDETTSSDAARRMTLSDGV